MNIKEYLDQFDVTENESKLHILVCKPENDLTTEQNIVRIDPKALSKRLFKDQTFNLALCSNFLFTNNKLSENDHLETLLELTRIASEVRIMPLLDAHGQPSIHLGPILQALQQKGYGVELREIKSQHKPQGQAFLRLWNPSCSV